MPPCSLSVPPPPAPPASPPSFTRSDSSSACISCQARIRHWQWKAGRVWYLTAWTSWLWIYADDESRCPPATLLLPLLWSVYSSNISTIMILLWSTILLCLFLVLFQLLSVPAIVQNTSGLKLSHKDILQNFILLFVSAIQQTLLSTLRTKILKSCGLAGLIMKFWLCLTGVQRSLLHKPILHLRSLTFSNKIQSLYVNLCKTGGVRISVYHPSPLH